MSLPDWAAEMLRNPIDYDTEWGESCRWCGRRSTYRAGHAPRYVLEHYIDCSWVLHADEIGIPADEIHIYEPTLRDPCATCGYRWDDEDDWRGRDMPEPVGDYETHEAHLAAEAGMTVEQYRNRPIRMLDLLPPFDLSKRGGITFVTAPALPIEFPVVRSIEPHEGQTGFICAPPTPLYDLQRFNTDRRPIMDADDGEEES